VEVSRRSEWQREPWPRGVGLRWVEQAQEQEQERERGAGHSGVFRITVRVSDTGIGLTAEQRWESRSRRSARRRQAVEKWRDRLGTGTALEVLPKDVR